MLNIGGVTGADPHQAHTLGKLSLGVHVSRSVCLDVMVKALEKAIDFEVCIKNRLSNSQPRYVGLGTSIPHLVDPHPLCVLWLAQTSRRSFCKSGE